MFNWLSLIGYKLNPGESPGEFAVKLIMIIIYLILL